MEDFQLKTLGMIYRAMDKSPYEPFDIVERDELAGHLKRVVTDISWVAAKELEAYMTLNTCRNYDQLAKLIMKREGKNLKKSEYAKLLRRLRTRAHRGRKKVIERLSEIYNEEV